MVAAAAAAGMGWRRPDASAQQLGDGENAHFYLPPNGRDRPAEDAPAMMIEAEIGQDAR
jgi:hypothetical protein